MAQVHIIKISPESYSAIINGAKKAEVRLNDSDYNIDDSLIMLPFSTEDNSYLRYDQFDHDFHLIESEPLLSDGILVDLTYIEELTNFNSLVLLNFRHVTQYRRRSFLLAKAELEYKYVVM